ncbi:MAG: DUF1622 domain-containing protein [Parachlamydia sp.]|jgi:uncharacterized membrane protein|nr:DUF1622 domain-containing protein [Parachlamydia sp.]
MTIVAQALSTLETLAWLQMLLVGIKQLLAAFGAIIILAGGLAAFCQFVLKIWSSEDRQFINFDPIRLSLGRSIILGLEFIIAADVIETTTAPDYYALGILGILVVLRTFLTFTLNRDLISLANEDQVKK